MARRARRKLPKHVRRALDEKQKQAHAAEAIDPLRTENPILTPPPEVQRAPRRALPAPPGHSPIEDGVPYAAHRVRQALPPLQDEIPAEQLLQQLGAQVLVGREADDACTFWIDLKEELLDGVRIQITLHKGRRVSARMIVTNTNVEQMLQQNIPRLRARLQRRGLFLHELEVIVS